MLTKTEWLIEWTNIVNCNGYLCDWMNNTKSVQWFSFHNPSQNRWATNLIQEDHSFNHSSFVFYNHWKWDWSIIWLSVQIKESINQSIHELINDAHFMQWITIIRLSLLTNGTLLQGYCIFYHSFFQSFAFVFISWMHDCGIESMPILYAIIYPFPTNNKTNKNSNNNEIGYDNGHQYRWLIIWKWKWIQINVWNKKEMKWMAATTTKCE